MDSIWKVHSIERVKHYNDYPTNSDPGVPLEDVNTTIGSITNVSFPVNATVRRDVVAGDVFAQSGSIDFTTVDLQFTTIMAKEALEVMGISGECINPEAVDASSSHFNIYLAEYECSGPKLTGTPHRKYTINKGILHLVSINCDHKGDLEVTGILKAAYDGTNDPVVIVDGVGLPASTQIGDQTARWTLDEAAGNTINGNNVDGIRQISIDAGVTTSSQGKNSEQFDFFVGIDSVLPVVTVQGINPEWVGATAGPNSEDLGLTIDGAAVTHANTKFHFRKRNNAGGFVADGTAEHISISAAGPAFYSDLLSGNATEPATCTVRIEPIDDGTNAPLVIQTNQAIT